MSFIRADHHPDPDSPEDPLYYAPRSARSTGAPPSSVAPQTRSDDLPPAPPLSRFDEMREEAFAKSTRPLQSQFDYERRPSRGLLAAGGAIAAAIGVTVILALVLFNVFPGPKSDPPELAVSISILRRLRRAKRCPRTPRHCCKDSSSFREAKPRNMRLRTRLRWNQQSGA